MTLPNIITGIRFLLIPVFSIVYFSSLEHARLVALLIFIGAMALDVLDGFIARRFHMVTNIGKMLDPVADKCLVITVISCLVSGGIIHKWFLYFVICKECIMILAGTVMYGREKLVIPSNVFGKLATFLMFLFLVDAMYFGKYLTVFSWVVVGALALAFVTYAVKLLCIKKGQGTSIAK